MFHLVAQCPLLLTAPEHQLHCHDPYQQTSLELQPEVVERLVLLLWREIVGIFVFGQTFAQQHLMETILMEIQGLFSDHAPEIYNDSGFPCQRGLFSELALTVD